MCTLQHPSVIPTQNNSTDSIIFCSADFVALVVQAVGGGMAATANTRAGADQGGKIMLGGIIFQLGMSRL
jgi:hypothetical protein